ncbi:MAG TPA: TIGR03619 family F420-dependent LLM class oxidoreductase [Acidimicrobiales bacterium]|jgi:probable F420-dependent oxidoreductase
MASVRLSVNLPTFGTFLGEDLHRVVEMARICEDAGVDEVTVSDHVVMGPDVTLYPWGRFPTPPDGPWLEPLVVLAAVGGATARVGLHTSILVAPLRPAAVLAKQAATLDVVSGGRLSLGVGTGWQEAEFAAVGLDFAARGRLLDETIGACRALWTTMPAAYAGETVRFVDTYCSPRPTRPGGVPVSFSGTLTARNRRRIVTLGDGWHPIMTATPDDIAAGVADLRRALDEAGRDPAALTVHHTIPVVRGADGVGDPAATFADAQRWTDAGVTTLQTGLRGWVRDPADAADRLAAVVTAFRAATA